MLYQKYTLFLDDTRYPNEYTNDLAEQFNAPIRIVRNMDAFKDTISAYGCPINISFDYDLGADYTGLDVAKWFAKHILDTPGFLHPQFTFTVHSMNPSGANNITHFLNQFFVLHHQSRFGDARKLIDEK